jgi:hypothetical protein
MRNLALLRIFGGSAQNLGQQYLWQQLNKIVQFCHQTLVAEFDQAVALLLGANQMFLKPELQ